VADAYLNGNWQPIEETRVPVLDRGFMFGDGVYEVIPFHNGRIFGQAEHLARLQQSLAAVGIKPPLSNAAWGDLFAEAIRRASEVQGTLYIQVTRGIAEHRTHVYPDVEPTVLVTSSPWPDRGERRPISVATRADIRWQRCDIKVISLIANGLVKNEVLAQGFDEAILIRDGLVTEAASANVFMVKNGLIKTPIADHRLLHGITRSQIIGLAERNAMPVEQVDITVEELAGADEVWISSTTQEVCPVGAIDRQAIGDGTSGPVCEKLNRLFQQYKCQETK
jgi:D-alanine transaminase